MAESIPIGIIGGSGLYQMDGLEDIHEIRVTTPFGDPSDALIAGTIAGVSVVFLPRHGRGHIHTPTEVPYRANIYALKKLGVQKIISVSACGSLREDLHPGEVVVPDQVFDFTKNRVSSFFGDGLVAHISVAEPFCPAMSALLADAIAAAGGTVHRGGTFITIEGPRFSTKGESFVYRRWGMDIIGMTACPEAFLAREAGICYATMAHITDYDVWHASEEAVTVEMVIQVLNKNIGLAQRAIKLLVPRLVAAETDCHCAQALETAVITAHDRVPPATREKLRLLGEPYLA
ncbi:MAG TPA: S-methyl-5'-thioadenosine phosphorylase [Anaerolineae bacterium]|nr:S-methyl-5'-thioadenosine phosphorylase [Anaerolineae bacterium]HQK14309.1 S-methyl-5'-thioadenosine phosphorylase [Anaerolineae bacterium]